MPIGLATFPGINKIISVNFTWSPHGTAPSAAVVEIAPQAAFPAPVGNLTLTYGNVIYSFPKCKLNTASFARNARGLVWSLQIIDRRWLWADKTINGQYNLRNGDESLDTATEKTPRELAALLLDAMGEGGYNVSALPNETRPVSNWDYANAAQELDRLCDSFGCRVVDQGVFVKICQVGVGAELPSNLPIADDSGSIDPPEVPDSLRVIFQQTRVQGVLACRPVGLDTDKRTKLIADLSYKPAGGWGTTVPGHYLHLSNTDPTGAGNQSNSPRALATRTLYRWYQFWAMLDDEFDAKLRPQLGTDYDFHFETVDQLLPLLPDLLDIDSVTGQPAAPYVQGVFATRLQWNNSAAWTQYTKPFTIHAEQGIVDFSDYVFKWTTAGSPSVPIAADIYLVACFNVRHQTTRQVHRVYREIGLGGSNGTGPRILRQDDVSGGIRCDYNAVGDITGFTTNVATLNQEADFQLNAAILQFQTEAKQDRTYVGFVKVVPDGAIQQITFASREGQGCTTRVSRNSEYSLRVPTYKERQWLEENRVRSTARVLADTRRRQVQNAGWRHV